MNTPEVPNTPRGKIVYFFWNNLPRFVLLALVVLILVLMGAVKEKNSLIAANKAKEIAQEKPPVNVITYVLSPTTITDRINLPGIVEPWTRLKLLSKIGGSITDIVVEEGDRVKKGAPLAHIEQADYKIALTRAEAAYSLAQSEYKRDKSIFDKGVIPTATLDINRTNLKTAKADYENAKLMLSRTTITSPMDGIIHKLQAKVGLQLSIGDPVAEILETDRMKGVVGIPESDVTAVRKLNTVDVTIQALHNKSFPASTHFLSPAPETTARIYNLELAINNDAQELLTGMFLRADIIKRQKDDVLTVPFYSVISRNDEQFVFVERDGVARKAPVSIGIMEKWMVEVTDGLHKGDHLILEGHRDVEDGQQLNVVRTLNSAEELVR